MGVTDPVYVAVSYTRNAELTLMLKCGAHKLAFMMKREVSQACIYVETRSFTGSHLCWNATLIEICVCRRNMTFMFVDGTRSSHLKKECNIHIYWWHMKFVFGIWDAISAFDTRLAYKALSSVIFWQPTDPLSKFSELRGWLGRFQNSLDFVFTWTFMIVLAISWSALSLILYGFWSSWVYCCKPWP